MAAEQWDEYEALLNKKKLASLTIEEETRLGELRHKGEMSRITKILRQCIAEQARYRCGYCLTLEVISGILSPKPKAAWTMKQTCGSPVVCVMKPKGF